MYFAVLLPSFKTLALQILQVIVEPVGGARERYLQTVGRLLHGSFSCAVYWRAADT